MRFVPVFIVVMGFGCGRSKAKDRNIDHQPTANVPTATTAARPAPRPATCGRLFAQADVERVVGEPLDWRPAPRALRGDVGECHYFGQGQTSFDLSLVVDCRRLHPHLRPSKQRLRSINRANYRDIDVEAGGAYTKDDAGLHQLIFTKAEPNCLVYINSSHPQDHTEALAAHVAAKLTVATVPK